MALSTRERVLVGACILIVGTAIAVRPAKAPSTGQVMLLAALDDPKWDGRLPAGCGNWFQNRYGGTDRAVAALTELNRRARGKGEKGAPVAAGEKDRCAGVLAEIRGLVAEGDITKVVKILAGEAETMGVR